MSGRLPTATIYRYYAFQAADSVGRATVLSAASMSYAVVRAPLKPLAGFAADLTTPLVTVAGLGGAFLLVALVLVVVSRPFSASTDVAASVGSD